MAVTTELKENWKEDMDRAIHEQDVMELRSRLDSIYNSLDEAIRNPKRIPQYRKVL
jgi:hypothetical protein